MWGQKARPPPKTGAPPKALEHHIDYTDSQVPAPAHRLYGGSGNLARASSSNDDRFHADGHDFSVIDPSIQRAIPPDF